MLCQDYLYYYGLAPTRSSALLHYDIFHAIASYLVCMFFFFRAASLIERLALLVAHHS